MSAVLTQLRSPRAALELKLLFAQLDLSRLERRKADLLKASTAWKHSMPLPGQTKLQCIARAEECSLKAFLLDADIAPLKLQIKNLESQLKSAPARVAPVVLTAEQLSAVDDTHSFREVVVA